MTEEPSGWLYSVVTRHWARIATGLVALLGLAEWMVGGLTADSGVESYLMVWAGTTGGLWFLFERAETAISERARERIADWLGRDIESALRGIPDQFSLLFDQVFGERHLTLHCFARSSVASVFSVLAVGLVLWSLQLAGFAEVVDEPIGELVSRLLPSLSISVALVVAINVVLDYVSLLETRWVLGRAAETGSLGLALVIDTAFTLFLAMTVWLTAAPIAAAVVERAEGVSAVLGPGIVAGFLSTFFTSAWLWLYAASVLLSRLLLRMNSGVGFLLRVTDVERQPFRSMGFVSVIILSAIFALGLPLVVL